MDFARRTTERLTAMIAVMLLPAYSVIKELWLPEERPAPGGTFEKSRTKIKNPASSAGPIRLTIRRIRAMLDSCLSLYS